MSILGYISPKFSVQVKQPPATQAEIEALLKFSQIDVPSDYLELIKEATEIEIVVDNKYCIRIWSPTSSIELNKAYEIQTFIPASLAIGDDEGGNALIYMKGQEGFGLYVTGFGDLVREDARMIAPTLKDFLIKNTGIDKLRI